MTSTDRVLLVLGVCLTAACNEVRLEDDGAGGDAGDTTSPATTASATTSAAETVSTNVSATSTTGGGVVETLPTDTDADLRAVLWDENDAGAVVVGGDAATILRLRSGAAPAPMRAGLEDPDLRISSLGTIDGKLFAGAFGGSGENQWAHVLRHDAAWVRAWTPATTCLEPPRLAAFQHTTMIATCGYYPWLGRIDATGAVSEVPDGFADVITASWPKWTEVLASTASEVHAIDPDTLARTNTWYVQAPYALTGMLQDHLERVLLLTETGDVLELGPFGTTEVLYPGDGTALRAGSRASNQATVLVGDAGKVLVLRGDAAPAPLDVGVTTSLRAIDHRYGSSQVAIAGDAGVVKVLTVD